MYSKVKTYFFRCFATTMAVVMQLALCSIELRAEDSTKIVMFGRHYNASTPPNVMALHEMALNHNAQGEHEDAIKYAKQAIDILTNSSSPMAEEEPMSMADYSAELRDLLSIIASNYAYTNLDSAQLYVNKLQIHTQAHSAVMNLQLQKQQEQISEQTSTLLKERIIFIIIIVLIATVIVFAVRRNDSRNNETIAKEKKRLEAEVASHLEQLEMQKSMLQVTNNRIQESINYAERIQYSVMPQPEMLDTYPIEGGFIFFQPLDIVSGDFYWFTKKGDNIIICCADCTGHGIPGAFMSMIAATIINNIVKNGTEDITPAEILEGLDERLIDVLSSNRSQVRGGSKDGLDIAISSINAKSHKVLTAAARRPVVLIKDQEIITVKGTKRSIGDIEPVVRERKFENTEIQLHTGDCIYMFSDGYTDQFGGQEGTKMKLSRIQKFLRSIHDDDIDEQSLTIQEVFTQWKGDRPQIDDVLFIGIKI